VKAKVEPTPGVLSTLIGQPEPGTFAQPGALFGLGKGLEQALD